MDTPDECQIGTRPVLLTLLTVEWLMDKWRWGPDSHWLYDSVALRQNSANLWAFGRRLGLKLTLVQSLAARQLYVLLRLLRLVGINSTKAVGDGQ